jgi:hypothetical protein
LSLSFCSHTSSCPRGGLRRRCAPRSLALAPPGGPSSMSSIFGGGRCRTLPPAPPGGPAIDVFNCGSGCCRTLPPPPPQGAHHRRLQLRWWPLPNIPPAPPRWPAINIFNFGGVHCQTCRQHPPRGLPSTSPTSGPSALAPPGGPPSTYFLALMVGALGPLAPAPPGGPLLTAE